MLAVIERLLAYVPYRTPFMLHGPTPPYDVLCCHGDDTWQALGKKQRELDRKATRGAFGPMSGQTSPNAEVEDFVRFSRREWEMLGVRGLRRDHYIQAGAWPSQPLTP